jgi:hypothetical protein
MQDRNQLTIFQFNAENLFIFMDKYQGQDLSAMTEDEWKDLTYTQLRRKQKPLYKIWKIADAIKDVDADIAMICEVGGAEALENLNKYFLDSKYDVYFVDGNCRRGLEMGYLVKKTLPFEFDIRSNRDLIVKVNEYNQSRGSRFARDISELRIYNPGAANPSLILLLIHLKSKITSDFRDYNGNYVREAEIRTLVDLYQKHKAEFNVPVIIGGDFNSELLSSEQWHIREAGLVDFHNVIESKSADRMTLTHFDADEKAHMFQYDFIFVPEQLVEHIDSARSFTYRYKGFYGIPELPPKTLKEKWALPSDHYPVVLTLKNVSSLFSDKVAQADADDQ